MVCDDDGAGGMWRTTGSWFLEGGGNGAGDGLRRRGRGRDCGCDGGSFTSGATTIRGGRVALVGARKRRGMGLVVWDERAGWIRLKAASGGRGSRA